MRKGIGIGTLMLGLTVAASGAWAEEEEEIALDKVPAEVMKAVKDKFEGAKISEASKEEEDVKTIYEIELTHEGSEYDVAVSSEGKILEIEREIDEDKLPEAVSRALKEKYPNLEIAKVEEITKDARRATRSCWKPRSSSTRTARSWKLKTTMTTKRRTTTERSFSAKGAVGPPPSPGSSG